MNDKKEEMGYTEEATMNIQTRIQNLMWTVSEDYELNHPVDVKLFHKSPYIAFYQAILQGCFEKYFDARVYDAFITKKVFQGLEPSVLLALGKLCIDSAVWKKAANERKGIAGIRRRAFRDTLEKDSFRLTHTDWDYMEFCYLKYVLDKEEADARIQPLLEQICQLEDAKTTEEICTCLEHVYKTAYEKGFAKLFKGLARHVKDYAENQKDYTERKAGLSDEDSAEDHPVNIFSGHVDPQDNGRREKPKSSVIIIDEDSVNRLGQYIEANYGKSCLDSQEQKKLSSAICTGAHKDCRMHVTKGVLHSKMPGAAKSEFVKQIKDENLKLLAQNQLVTRQNIQTLSNTLRRALLTRTEKEVYSSEYGNICVQKLWNIGRTKNRKLFQREIAGDNTDFAVEVLIDASGSQRGRQSMVALQGYMLSEALSIVGISHRVVSFCTFGAYTVLNEFRDYEDPRERNERIFEFYGSANNRDGLAVRAAAYSLDQRDEENKILIVLSDGRPNDIIAGQDTKKKKKEKDQKDQKEAYCLEYAVKDTAKEIRRLRNRKIAVLGVFAGNEEDLQAEKKIFGKDFAYIRDIGNFANVVGRYLRKQITQ